MSDLSPAEWKVLELVAAGKPNKAIARELGKSHTTVHDQLESIYRKLGVGNRTEAAVLFLKAQI